MTSRNVADVVGPWIDPDFVSGLIERLRRSWNVPISELSDEMLASFLRQEIATAFILPEARNRLEAVISDNSELYDGELRAAYQAAIEKGNWGSEALSSSASEPTP